MNIKFYRIEKVGRRLTVPSGRYFALRAGRRGFALFAKKDPGKCLLYVPAEKLARLLSKLAAGYGQVDHEPVTVQNYSTRAFVVTGPTYPYRREFKALGGRWNKYLRGGPAWVFAQSQRTTVIEILCRI